MYVFREQLRQMMSGLTWFLAQLISVLQMAAWCLSSIFSQVVLHTANSGIPWLQCTVYDSFLLGKLMLFVMFSYIFA